MKDKKDILLDAIGKVNEKYIENSMSSDKEPSLLIDDLITAQQGGAYEVKPVPKPEKKKFPVHMAVLSGLAAALMITAAALVINKLGAGKIETGGNATGTGTTPSEAVTPAVTSTYDLGKDTNSYYLQDKYPEYFECSTFKGLEVYPSKDPSGFWKFRLMSGTDRYKEHDEILAQPEISTESMRTILDWYRKKEPDVAVFVMEFEYVLSQEDVTEIERLLGISDTQPAETLPYPSYIVGEMQSEGVGTLKDYDEYDEQGIIPYYDPGDEVHTRLDWAYFKKLSVPYGDASLDIYLIGKYLMKDRDDPDIMYGSLNVVIPEPGGTRIYSDIPVNRHPDIDIGDNNGHLYIHSFRADRLDDYFGLYTIRKDDKEYRVIRTAYGTYGEGFDTRFWLIDEDAGPTDSIAAPLEIVFTGTTDAVDTDGGVMLSHSLFYLENHPFDLTDSINGTMLCFDFVNREVFIAAPDALIDTETYYEIPAEDGTPEDVLTVDDLTVIPNYNELVTATFEIQTQSIYRHDPNPGENPPWYSLAVIGGNVYSMETFDITAETFLKETEDMYVDNDYFRQVIKQYCEGDALIPEKLISGRAIEVTAAGFLDNEPLRGTYYYLNENYVLSTYDSGKSFRVYKLDATHTKFRKIIELLWDRHRSTNTPYDETRYFPHVMAVMTKDFDTDEEYLKIINDGKLDKIKSAITEEVPGAEGLYRLVTPEQEKADWLPVTELRDLGEGALAYENTSQVDIYNVAFDCGVYSGTETYNLFTEYDTIADRLKELGAGDAAEKFRKEARTAASNGFSFETLTAYDSILDYVKLGNRWSIYWKITDDIIIEYILNANGEPYPDGSLVRILTKEPQLTAVRNIVTYFRDRRETTMYHNDTGGEVYYKIDSIYVIWDKLKTPGSTEPNAKFLVLTDREEYADYIREYAQYNQIDIPEDRLTITSNPIDLGDIPTYDPF